MHKGKALRLLSAIVLSLIGILTVVVIGPEPSTREAELPNSLGFGFIVSGVATLFREWFVLKTETDESAEVIAAKTLDLMKDTPVGTKGLKMVTDERRGYSGYYSWPTVTEPQELFFAGRSVLNRINNDLLNLHFGNAEEVLARKLKDGSSITVLFLDPRSNLIERLADEEGQSKMELLSDIAFSVGVCSRLYPLLRNTQLRPSAELHIRVYDEVPNFAFHREDKKIIVGFYFATSIGSTSAAFETIDDETGKFFQGHFDTVCFRSKNSRLLEIAPQTMAARFNSNLYEILCSSLVKDLGKRRAEGLIAGAIDPTKDNGD